ncbi:RraA-like protein [Sporormia fimetaria CBS 119925]|uniref:RraA-like protein n=1 Tax=Sporormia fimetaria CBS 119925 TaxID=1340428 RepID=A0A6A6VI78_9PLEO|nr:RraA-like protein [Sporormia fimetaria CBS 119925]
MVPKPTPSFPNPAPVAPGTPMSNLTNATPYADLTRPQTIVLISQPAGQACAVVGGIMAARMQRLGAKAVVVDGRVRDLGELRKLEVPVWSKGTSVIGAGAETKFHAREVEIRVGETVVRPGDLVMVDEEERGIVCVPVERVEEVLELMEKSVAADERVLEDVRGGGSVGEAFKKFRS